MALKDWKLSDYEKNYVVWLKQDLRMGNYNKFSLVVKTENGKWIVFVDGGDAGHQILNYPKSRETAIKFAKSYMRTH
ncbi:MAG TPA: hypothetical protein VI911_04020 [Patescibacteria group bacterium]|nr:hypothetical protein [Patescibacteria group bacterium]